MKIEITRDIDLKEIIFCHKKSFPKSLSTLQGNNFILSMYNWYIQSERGLLFHIKDSNNKMVGYCGGIITLSPGLPGAVSSITQYAFKEIVKSFLFRPWLFFHIDFMKKWKVILRNLLLKLKLSISLKSSQSSQVTSVNFEPFLGLVVIGVIKEYQNLGYGSKLLEEFNEIFKLNNEVKYASLSVKNSNEKAIKAYLRNGWIVQNSIADYTCLIKEK